MLYVVIKALISGAIIAAVSEIAKRSPGIGALVASLPLVSVLGMIWLWRDTQDRALMASHAGATFWFVLPSLPMFLLIPVLLGRHVPFWLSLGAGCLLTMLLYLSLIFIAPRVGVRL
jgi:hypothetical protein